MIPHPAGEKPLRSRVFKAARIIVSLALLVLVLREMGIENTAQALRNADVFWIVMVLVLMLVEGLHGTYKWLILLRHTDKGIRFWPLFKIIYVSGFVGMFVPGGIGIELVRMYGLAKHTSDLAMSFTSILMDRVLGLTGLVLVVLAGVLMQGRSEIPGIEWWTGGALLLILAGWIAIMNPWFRRLTDWMLSAPILAMLRDKQNKIYASLDTYRGRPGLLAWGMVQSLIFNVLRILVVWVGAMAVGIDVPLNAYFIVVPAVIFAMLIPISMSGWGVREAMFVALLPLYGANPDTVFAMSLLVGVCAVLSTTPGAVILITGMGTPKPKGTKPNGTVPTPSNQH